MSQNNATDWQPAQPGEERSPCPALNSLANGGASSTKWIASRPQLITAIVGRQVSDGVCQHAGERGA